jgi:hypothetical protein
MHLESNQDRVHQQCCPKEREQRRSVHDKQRKCYCRRFDAAWVSLGTKLVAEA